MTMGLFSKRTSPGLFLALVILGGWGCTPRLTPVTPPGVALRPGHYLTAYYRAPDFEAATAVYSLAPFPVIDAQGVAPDTFQTIFKDELGRALEANGLKLSPQGDAVLDGTVQQISVRGGSVRFVLGKIWSDLTISGAITRADQTLFAFQDQVHLTSPVSPGAPAPKETELLLRQLARTFAGHLLNEILLYWPPAEGK
jgi:hypothetical protein